MAASLKYVSKAFRLQNVLASVRLSFHNSRFPLFVNQRYSSSDSSSASQTENKQSLEPVKGKVYDKQPIKTLLEAGKDYFFCTCGFSKHQPFCDGSHKAQNFTASRPHHNRYKPLPFTVQETKEYFLCLCKQSNKRPFCDGTHKRPDIQADVHL